MTCPKRGVILRHLSGELAPEQRRDFQEHLGECSVCRAARDELRESWELLGGWEIDAATVDLTDRILARTDAGRRPLTPTRPTPWWAATLRAAASIALAVGMGVAAGYLVPVAELPGATEPAATPAGVAGALAWIGPAAESATGLPLALDPDAAPEGGETP